ncbi:hypothetical protein PFICI_12692 [Pestalotiopsis fici W106-1]|uniref:Nudix hydrolase domain-containing protein n=1 Tax=Pestalotiopsis fici (strain W106-1 / CGMCC3.15140) TaxID=1229662 RepID=W3WPH6_PESFW|nr:uncharacterized protein PFICI_12692 [Pestalotiopsis fici W106-1]ETS75748.1 hypothetical protein PFICI_12692 [Pestalotiopsis fici W106-1]
MGPTLTQNQKHILAMSKAEYLSHVGNVGRDSRLQVAAAVFKIDIQSSRPTILLLKRRSHDSYEPGEFEVPSGSVDDSDFIISDSIARAVQDQSNLRVFRIDAMLREKRWSIPDLYYGDEDMDISNTLVCSKRESMQLNWAVTVHDIEDIIVASEDHDEFVWATWASLNVLNLSTDTRDLAKEALTWAARRLCA